MAVAAVTTENGGERARDRARGEGRDGSGGGEAQRRARGGQVGEMGGGRGVVAALSPPGVGVDEVVGRGCAPVATRTRGTGGRGERPGRRAGPGRLGLSLWP